MAGEVNVTRGRVVSAEAPAVMKCDTNGLARGRPVALIVDVYDHRIASARHDDIRGHLASVPENIRQPFLDHPVCRRSGFGAERRQG